MKAIVLQQLFCICAVREGKDQLLNFTEMVQVRNVSIDRASTMKTQIKI